MTRWVLQVDIGSETIAGGSGGQYFVEHFDGSIFKPGHSDTRWGDYGKDWDLYGTCPNVKFLSIFWQGCTQKQNLAP